MKTQLKLVKLYSDNHEGTVMTESQYKEETLSMSTGDFHMHRKEEFVNAKPSSKIKTIERWIAELNKKKRVWKKSEIGAITKMINSINYEKNFVVKNYIGLLRCETSIGKFEHSITKEQSKFAIEYLLNRYFKKTGEPRKNCPFGTREERILKSFKKFSFVGVHSEQQSNYRWIGAVPVYRVYAKNGEYFDYSPVHWGTPIIHN